MTLSRRRFAATAAALPLAAAASPGRAASADALTLVLMGDLHSGYRWSSHLLHAVTAAVSGAAGPVVIVVNGDLFERNNVVARRGDGVIDLALLRGFARLAPTLVTIGNHDSDLFDPRRFAAETASTGAILLSDMLDPRDGTAYGAPGHTVTLRGGARVRFAALGTPNLALYPRQWRDCYRIPDPADYAARRLPELFAGASLPVALVHAGFDADRAVLPWLPHGALLHGAHDHLRFAQPQPGGRLHLQSGAWSSAFQVATIRLDGDVPVVRVRDVVLDMAMPQDNALQALVEREYASRLQAEDRAVVGQLPAALSLEQAVRRTADQVRRAVDADLALLSHTSFGDGLPAGAVTAFDMAGFLRFDGALAVGSIPQDRLPGLLSRLDQFDGVTAYARRTGDYLHASDRAGLPAGRALKVAVNSYAVSSAANRIALFGWDVPGFVPASTAPRLSDVVRAAIAA